MDSVELLMAVEEKFQIVISDREAGKIVTVEDLYNVILVKVEEKSGGCLKPLNKEEVWGSLRSVIVQQAGVKLEKVTKEARIVKDLGID